MTLGDNVFNFSEGISPRQSGPIPPGPIPGILYQSSSQLVGLAPQIDDNRFSSLAGQVDEGPGVLDHGYASPQGDD